MVLKQDGSLWATGHNKYGQLGTGWGGTTNTVFSKVIVDGVKAVAAGAYHSMALKEDGSFWATGSNEDGQFGDGWTISYKVFVELAPFGSGMGHNYVHMIYVDVPQLFKHAILYFTRSVHLLTCLPVYLPLFAYFQPLDNPSTLSNWLYCEHDNITRHQFGWHRRLELAHTVNIRF